MSANDETDLLDQDVDLALALYKAQPEHPQIAALASRVLASKPDHTGMKLLLGNHLRACKRYDEARTIFQGIAGQNDTFLINAAQYLRELETLVCNYEAALTWADLARQLDPEGWHNQLHYGGILAHTERADEGWRLMEEAVALCAHTDPDNLGNARIVESYYLIMTYAPPERFVPSAEEAIRLDPSNSYISDVLLYAYLLQGRFEDCRKLALRLLREDPTNSAAGSLMRMFRTWDMALETNPQLSYAQIHESGILARYWTQIGDERVGVGPSAALAALDAVLPAAVSDTLLPGLSAEEARDTLGEAALVAWHDGQRPGAGDAWGLGGAFRLLSSAEIAQLEDSFRADAEAHPQWQETTAFDAFWLLMTDDADAYVVCLADGSIAIRRPAMPDEKISPCLSDLLWGLVVAFGGTDTRPPGRRGAH
ncbi:tetratricopeptide repeat protein [Micropruina sp.]|uniref:tetratricopeptide repeat protein n=1 Tax=Micropruina sp. TaxID=2737536 RepID=UPI0039E28096